tara:strand:+ start:10811 stop:11491 length:681 start_codon:yes stop_codon:yes gene_type:complete
MSSQKGGAPSLNEIYISRKTLLKYLRNQKYNTKPFDNFTIAEINAMEQTSIQQNAPSHLNQLNFEVQTEPKNKVDKVKTCSVFYHIHKPMKKSSLQEMINEYYDEEGRDKENCSLIVVLSNINDTNMNIVKEIWEKYKEYCVLYDLSSLQYNILEHTFVPKHIKLTEEQKKMVKLKYNILDDSQIPEISMFDPVGKAMLLRPGELCKIIRYDKISFQNDFYRICVI